MNKKDICCTGIDLRNALNEKNLTQKSTDGKIPWNSRIAKEIHEPGRLSVEMWSQAGAKGHQGTFCRDANVLYLDWGGGSTKEYVFQNSNCTLKMSGFIFKDGHLTVLDIQVKAQNSFKYPTIRNWVYKLWHDFQWKMAVWTNAITSTCSHNATKLTVNWVYTRF